MKVRIDGRTFVDYASFDSGLAAPGYVAREAGLLPLLSAGRLGVLLAQFPYSFHNTEENRAYLVKLTEVFGAFPLAVEVRHRSWQQRAVREFLSKIGVDFCNIDQP